MTEIADGIRRDRPESTAEWCTLAPHATRISLRVFGVYLLVDLILSIVHKHDGDRSREHFKDEIVPNPQQHGVRWPHMLPSPPVGSAELTPTSVVPLQNITPQIRASQKQSSSQHSSGLDPHSHKLVVWLSGYSCPWNWHHFHSFNGWKIHTLQPQRLKDDRGPF